METFIEKISSGKAQYIEDFKDIANYVLNHVQSGDIIVVFGAGNSYNLTRFIIERLTEK